ncbi:MAG: phospho-N-acetylmuramoyl-pentapeptide-transferase [Actinomycetota bacterium]
MVQYVTAPFLIASLAALAAGWFLIPILRKLKAGQTISTDAPGRHLAKGGTPTMGGLIILIAGLGIYLAYPRPHGGLSLAGGVALCTLGFGIIGFLDDFLIVRRGKNLGLRAREKLLGQFIVAIAFSAWYVFADPGRAPLDTPLVTVPRVLLAVFHVLLLVGMSNAVNLTDGLDGLAAGVTLPTWLVLGVLGALAPVVGDGASVNTGLVVFCAAFAGATLGYLWYNAHPAQVFMGDTGSLAIGGGLTAAAIALRQEWILLIAAAVPLVEMFSVMLQVAYFKTTGKRIFKMSPLHHHFELCDWPETRIVVRFGIISALCGVVALVAAYYR